MCVPDPCTHTHTHTQTQTHTHTHDENHKQEQSKKSGERKLRRSCRAALDVFRSVHTGGNVQHRAIVSSVAPSTPASNSDQKFILGGVRALYLSEAMQPKHMGRKLRRHVKIRCEYVMPVLGAPSQPRAHSRRQAAAACNRSKKWSAQSIGLYPAGWTSVGIMASVYSVLCQCAFRKSQCSSRLTICAQGVL